MSIVAQSRNTRLWHLWNTEYLACGSDVGDEGFILQTEDGWALHERGREARLRSIFPTLDDAMRAAGVRDHP